MSGILRIRSEQSRFTLRPFEMVYGFLCLWGPIPKCLTASRVDRLPRSKIVYDPVGARRASWSKVKASPPAFKMRSFAEVVKRRAAIVNFGVSSNRTSSVTVPMLTMTFESRSGAEEVSLMIFDRETGGRLVFERKRRWSMTWF